MISEKKQLRGFVPAAYVVLTHKLVRQTTGRPAPWPVGHSRLFAQTREELCGLSSVQPVQTGLSGCWQHVHCWRMGDIAQGRARFSQRPLRTGQEWFLEFSNHTLGRHCVGDIWWCSTTRQVTVVWTQQENDWGRWCSSSWLLTPCPTPTPVSRSALGIGRAPAEWSTCLGVWILLPFPPEQKDLVAAWKITAICFTLLC